MIKKLEMNLDYSLTESPIPKEHQPHPLIGDFFNYLPCLYYRIL